MTCFKAFSFLCGALVFIAVPSLCSPAERISKKDINPLLGKHPELHSLTDLFKEICSSKPSTVCKKIYGNLRTGVCFARVIVVTEHRSGVIDIDRKYEIIFEDPNKLKTEIEKDKSGVIFAYNITDVDTGLSEILNFTKISKTDNPRVSRHRLLSCGEGASLTEFYFPETKRLVITLNPEENLETSFSTQQDSKLTKKCVNCTQEDDSEKVGITAEFLTATTEMPIAGEVEGYGEVLHHDKLEDEASNLNTQDSIVPTILPDPLLPEADLVSKSNSHDERTRVQQISFKGDIFVMKKYLDGSAEFDFKKN